MNRFENEVEKIELTPRFLQRVELHKYAIALAFLQNKGRPCRVWEFGVASGKTINQMASFVGMVSHLHGFDSFKGLPERWGRLPAGTFARDTPPEVRSNVTLHEGFFTETLPTVLETENPPHVIHIDCDLYQSTKDILDMFGPLSYGTIVIFDELYNHIDYQLHEMKAWLEYVDEHDIDYEYIGHVARVSEVKNKGPFQAALKITGF